MTDLRADSMTGEQYVFEERTADPASTVEGERWLRTDLNSGDKLATLRVDVGGSTLDVPVFPTGTSEDGVTEALRLRVGSQTGYIPAVADTSAAGFPQLRLQHDGQVYGYHDAQGFFAFFDVEITSTNAPVFTEEELDVNYSVENTGFSFNNTQDIRLLIDNLERDRDTNITLSPGNSTTGTLNWTAPSGSGEFDVKVESDDDSAFTRINVLPGPAIPDSGDLQARWDATELSASSGTAITDWPDATGNGHNLTSSTGQAYQTDAIGGNPVVRFDGVDDYLSTTWPAISQPYTVFIVFQYQSIPSGFNSLSSFGPGLGTLENSFQADSTSNWSYYAGGSRVNGGTPDTNPHILSLYVNGGSTEYRLDGTQLATGDAGANDLTGVVMAARDDQSGDFSNVDIGEQVVYPMDKTGIYADVESYLSDKWGITL